MKVLRMSERALKVLRLLFARWKDATKDLQDEHTLELDQKGFQRWLSDDQVSQNFKNV
ncbi:UNVERIFIED_CONTAM: hypothetical protein Sangu_2926000 [Sesamum angustifolium]|uniref:Uncharacterized protein n=1 Tax=Sesamum angustifolium TaxID=2727405 RepID=A0AAW2IKJ5_9LAMI